MKSITLVAGAGVLAAAAFVVFVPAWTGVPHAAEEVGFPQQVLFHDAAEFVASNQAPPPLPPAATGGPSATEAYKNVTVLTDVSAAEFMRLQEAITAWVSPKEGCGFCHAGDDYASDTKPQKAAARVMLQMTRHLNTDWAGHMAGAGVTCYSCHRGQPVPAGTWFPDAPAPQRRFVARQENWQESANTVRGFFPDNGFAEYFLDDQPIAVQSSTAEPSHTINSWPEATRIYEMMMQMSDGIGANCGYCHNSRAFQSWAESTPYRWIGYDAIRLVRDVNRNFLLRVAPLVPQSRTLEAETRIPALPARMTGAQAGNGLVTCITCHQGVTKPLNGVNMVRDYPGLTAPAPQPDSASASPPTPASTTASASTAD